MEINIINPASSRYHAIKDFKRLTPIKKGLTVAISSVVAVMTLGFLVTPVFRLLVKKWTVINDKKDTTTKQIDRLGNEKIGKSDPLIPTTDNQQKGSQAEELHHEQKGSQAEEVHHEQKGSPSRRGSS